MCVRCGTGKVAWCTNPTRHAEDDITDKQVAMLRIAADSLMLVAGFDDLRHEAISLRAKVCEKLRTLDDVPDEEDDDSEVFTEAAEDYRRGRY